MWLLRDLLKDLSRSVRVREYQYKGNDSLESPVSTDRDWCAMLDYRLVLFAALKCLPRLNCLQKARVSRS